MIYLITGVPGAGKTLYAVELIEQFLGDGRQVYADIDELAMDVEAAPDDWRETPEGSVVVYDECQRRFGASGSRGGRSENEQIAAMETHRHTGHDLVLITQHPNLLHAHVRRLVGRHFHLHRRYGGINVFAHDRCLKVDSKSDLDSAERVVWSHPKRLFGRYKSASIHTHKMPMPSSLKVVIGAAVLAVVLIGYAASTSKMFAFLHAPEAEAAVATVVPEPVQAVPAREGVYWVDDIRAAAVEVEVAPEHDPARWRGVVGGCVATEQWCRCYDRSMEPIDMPYHVCRVTVSEPLARPPVVSARGTSAPTGGFAWSRSSPSNTGPNSQVRENGAANAVY